MTGNTYCPEGRLLKEGFLPFNISSYNYGEGFEYDPFEHHPLFYGVSEKMVYNCRSKTTLFPSHSDNVSDTIVLYDKSKDIKLFGVKKKKNSTFFLFFFLIFYFIFFFKKKKMRMIGSGYFFALNIPTDYIPKQIAYNAISIASSFPREWSTEKHKHFSNQFKEIILTLLISFQIHKKNKTLSIPPKPIQILIFKLFSFH